eukprot:GHVS01078251.1.p1 GENE.GHVS01078251.1~~GHVS01078251.1.p1  ORF type:complete len:339 (+),score=30.41 GHVS01078251.1:185-1201(+)
MAKGAERYEQLDSHIGQGTYGKVEKARDKTTGRVVAIKKVKVEVASDEENKKGRQSIGSLGIHFTTIREIKVMREIQHPNIMGLLDVFVEGDFMNLVMDHMESDLKKVLDSKVRLSESHVKCIMLQILSGLKELHGWWFVHRDLSPANVFVNSDGICKVADFGLTRMFGWYMKEARFQHEGKRVEWSERMTDKVVTLWYRPPELMFGATKYGSAIDIWSAGCIFAELLNGGKALFPGTGEIDQLGKIFHVRGTPSDTNWKEARDLPLYCEFTKGDPQDLATLVPGCAKAGVSLLDDMLALDPNKRINAEQGLKHSYFNAVPLPCTPSELPLNYLRGSK